MLWKTPEALYSSYNRTQVSVGLNGHLMEPAVAEQKGFILQRQNSTIEIGLPYNVEGGFRKVRLYTCGLQNDLTWLVFNKTVCFRAS